MISISISIYTELHATSSLNFVMLTPKTKVKRCFVLCFLPAVAKSYRTIRNIPFLIQGFPQVLRTWGALQNLMGELESVHKEGMGGLKNSVLKI